MKYLEEYSQIPRINIPVMSASAIDGDSKTEACKPEHEELETGSDMRREFERERAY